MGVELALRVVQDLGERELRKNVQVVARYQQKYILDA